MSQPLDELKSIEGNDVCADCGQKDPTWASKNLGIFVCVDCVAAHRAMGVQISQPQSLTLDHLSPEKIKYFREIGNERSNRYYMKNCAPYFLKPNPDTPPDIREYLIRLKYEHKAFVDQGNEENENDSVVNAMDEKEGFFCENPARYPMPQRLIQKTFKKHGKNSKISLELLSKNLRIYDKTDDSFPSKIFDTTTLEVTIVQNEKYKSSLNFYLSISQGMKEIVAVEPPDVKCVVVWVNAIRRAAIFYKDNPETTIVSKPLQRLSRAELQDSTVLGPASKQGGSWKKWKKRFWVIHQNVLYYFEKDPTSLNEDAIPQDGICLQGAGVARDENKSRSGKDNAILVAVPDRTFYIQTTSKQSADTFYKKLTEITDNLENRKIYDFSKKQL